VRESIEDSRDQSSENSEEEISEEVPRTHGISVIPGPVYRPPQVVTPTSNIRATPATPPPPPPPPAIQYRPTHKPTKAPRKPIVDDVTFKQPIKPVKPSQAYEIRGKKPVAQVSRSLDKIESKFLIYYFNLQFLARIEILTYGFCANLIVTGVTIKITLKETFAQEVYESAQNFPL